MINPNGAGGHNVPALFQKAISPRKKGSGGPKFLDDSILRDDSQGGVVH